MAERAGPSWDALFDPQGVIVAGASPHPGRFGTVALHNLLAAGYPGRIFATSREGGEVLGVETVADVAELPGGVADLAADPQGVLPATEGEEHGHEGREEPGHQPRARRGVVHGGAPDTNKDAA